MGNSNSGSKTTFYIKYKQGFTQEEIEMLLNELPDIIDRGKFNNALTNITVMEREGNMIIYHCDIYSAIRCGIEKRDLRESEWD